MLLLLRGDVTVAIRRFLTNFPQLSWEEPSNAKNSRLSSKAAAISLAMHPQREGIALWTPRILGRPAVAPIPGEHNRTQRSANLSSLGPPCAGRRKSHSAPPAAHRLPRYIPRSVSRGQGSSGEVQGEFKWIIQGTSMNGLDEKAGSSI